MSDSILRSLEFLKSSADFVELKSRDFHIDLRYGTDNNFVGVNMYGPFQKAFLHRVAAEKMFRALELLKKRHPDHRFIIFDALRPRSIQRILWKHVEGTEGEKYIARPEPGSLHNFGFAVDLSVLDSQGREIDMGAGFDDFRPIAQPQLEARFLASGELNARHIANRDILRGVMHGAGFKQLAHEWWHFDALPEAEVKDRYVVVE
ncbi:MAG TPA: M15 family metallopeptidase [Bdellovibrionales bacterium]|nr:M15 family metallopeptidase [Bdellovibrionales bacterium]